MSDQNIFKEFTSENPGVHGRTTINHEARMKLLLNCSEYVFMDWFYRETSKGKEPEVMDCYVNTGFTPEQQGRIMKGLIVKGFLLGGIGDSPTITEKWTDGFADFDQEFERFFWVKNGKVCWHGSKPQALKLYVTLRKNHSREFLLKQRDTYFKFLDLEHKTGFPERKKLMASVFLGPKERFNEDWATQAKELEDQLAKKNEEYQDKKDVKPVTADQVKDLYGKDNS